MERIASRQNPLIARFRELARSRGAGDAVLLDGEHLLQEAMRSSIPIEVAAFTDQNAGLAHEIARSGARVVLVGDQLLSAISPVHHPSGAVAIGRVPAATLDEAFRGTPQLVLVLTGIQDSGNVGAIIRAAEACGATGVVTTEGTADPFGWRALRGAMGSTFRLPIAPRQSLQRVVEYIHALRLRLIATVPRLGTPLPSCDLRAPAAILLGGEGAGLAEAVIAESDERISIPMRVPVESLNVATAAALIVYEASRQRDSVPDIQS